MLLPVPDQPNKKATHAILTMNSCHPEFSARERYIAYAELDATLPGAARIDLIPVEAQGFAGV